MNSQSFDYKRITEGYANPISTQQEDLWTDKILLCSQIYTN